MNESQLAATQAMQKQLQSGERLLWSGLPRQGLFLRGSDYLMIPFSLLWGGFAIFWEWMVVHARNAPAPMLAFGAVFAAIGLYFIFGRFLVDARQRRTTYYGVTNQRIIIQSGIFMRRTRSLGLATAANATLSEKDNGDGTIIFGMTALGAAMAPGPLLPNTGSFVIPKFDTISHARNVYNILLDAQRNQ